MKINIKNKISNFLLAPPDPIRSRILLWGFVFIAIIVTTNFALYTDRFVAFPLKELVIDIPEKKTPTPAVSTTPVPTSSNKKAAPKSTTTTSTSGVVEVRGDASCQQQIGAALSMLQSQAPDHYTLANKYLSYIECAAVGSSIDGTARYVHFTLGQATLDAGTLWVAGIIAHEYCHPMLYHQGKVWEGEQGESSCLEVQYDALQKMGAGPDLLDYVKNLAQTRWWEDPNDWW